jgi:hypothetical protein
MQEGSHGDVWGIAASLPDRKKIFAQKIKERFAKDRESMVRFSKIDALLSGWLG